MLFKRHFSLILFLNLLIFTFIVYYPAFYIDFFADDYFWVKSYINEGFSGIKYNFNDDFFLPYSHILQIAEIKIFGLNAPFFHIINYLMLALSGLFIFKNIKQLLTYLSVDIKDVNLIAAYSSLFFALSPYNTEVINWFTAQTYLFCTLIFLISLFYYIKFKLQSKPIYLVNSLFLLLLSFLSKEISVFSLFIFITLEIFVFKETLTNKLKTTSLYIFMAVIYFVLRFFFLYNIIGGYGSSIHLNFSLNLLLHNIISYNAKFLLLYRYLFPFIRESITNNNFIIISVLILIFIFILYYVFKVRKITFQSPIIKIIIFSYIFFIISLAPVINLETSFLKSIQSDRYGFFPSIFISVFFVAGIVVLFRSTFKHIFPISILLLYSVLNYSTNLTWKMANKVNESFANSIVNEINKGNSKLLIINVPDNFDGVYLFRNALKECISLKMANNAKFDIKFLALQNLSEASENKIELTMCADTVFFKTDSISNFVKLYNDTSKYYQKEISQFISPEKNYFKLAINKMSDYTIFYFSENCLKRVY